MPNQPLTKANPDCHAQKADDANAGAVAERGRTEAELSVADGMKCQAACAASSASIATCSSDAVYGLHMSSAATDVRDTNMPLW